MGTPDHAAGVPEGLELDRVARTRKLLRQVAIVAIIDTLLLIPLVYASFTDAEGLISVLGPAHGVGFLAEVYLAVRGAGEKLWRWWFPAIIVVTGGPLGTLIGHVRISRTLDT
ncbi:MAG: DUF3817 domain-containing protein [Solirubrobacterales bacterium]